MGKGNTKRARRIKVVKTHTPKKSVETEENKERRRQKEINEAMYALGETLKHNELDAAKKAANEAAFWQNWKARSAERRLELAPTKSKTSPIQSLIEEIVVAPVRVTTGKLRKEHVSKKLNKTRRALEKKYGLDHVNINAERAKRYNALIAEGRRPNSAELVSGIYAWGLDPATRAMREGKVNWGTIVENEYPIGSMVATPRPVVTVVAVPSPIVEKEEVVPTKFVTLKITNLPNLTDKMRDKFVFKMGTLKKQLHGKLGDRQHIFPKDDYPTDPIDKFIVEEDTDEAGNLRLTAYVTYNKHEYAERVLESHAVTPITFKHFIKGEKQEIPVVIEPSGHKFKKPKGSD